MSGSVLLRIEQKALLLFILNVEITGIDVMGALIIGSNLEITRSGCSMRQSAVSQVVTSHALHSTYSSSATTSSMKCVAPSHTAPTSRKRHQLGGIRSAGPSAGETLPSTNDIVVFRIVQNVMMFKFLSTVLVVTLFFDRLHVVLKVLDR